MLQWFTLTTLFHFTLSTTLWKEYDYVHLQMNALKTAEPWPHTWKVEQQRIEPSMSNL